MANKRKGNLGYAAVNVNVKAHTRTVYKRKRFVIGKQTAKKKQKGKGLASSIASALWEVGKPAAENFYNTARRRQQEHAERLKRLYYYS